MAELYRHALLALIAAAPLSLQTYAQQAPPLAESGTQVPAQTEPAAARAQADLNLPGGATTTAAVAAPQARPVSPALRKKAQASYRHGAAQLEHRDWNAAARDFAAAVHDDPTVPAYYQALVTAQEAHVSGLLQTAARQRAANPTAADRLLAEARGVDPANPRILQRDAIVAQREAAVAQHDAAARQRTEDLLKLRFVPAEAIEALPNNSTHTFHENTDTRAFAQRYGQLYGLRALVDTDLQSASFRLDLENADAATAMRTFALVANVFATPLDEHTLLFASDTTANRHRLEHLLQKIVPLPGYSTEQINEFGTMLRTVFELEQRQVQTSPGLGALIIRAPEETLRAMDSVLADLVDSGSEVSVDIKLYSIDTTKVRNLGIVLPSSFTLFSVRSEINNVISANSSLITQLLANGVIPSTATPAEIAAYLVFAAGLGSSSTNLQNTFFVFGGGLNTLASQSATYGVTPVGIAAGSMPSLNFALQKSEAASLDDLQLRVANRQTAIFKAGTRYPIQTSVYSDIASSTTSSNGALASLLAKYLGTSASSLNTSAIIPQFQYEDLGLTVNTTPTVLNRDEVSVKLEVKVSALAGTALNGIPVLASRQFTSTLSLHDGQTIVMASHMQNNEASAVTGIPGLTALPGLGSLTNRSTNEAHTTLVLLVTPHLVRHSHVQAKGPVIALPQRPDDD